METPSTSERELVAGMLQDCLDLRAEYVVENPPFRIFYKGQAIYSNGQREFATAVGAKKSLIRNLYVRLSYLPNTEAFREATLKSLVTAIIEDWLKAEVIKIEQA